MATIKKYVTDTYINLMNETMVQLILSFLVFDSVLAVSLTSKSLRTMITSSVFKMWLQNIQDDRTLKHLFVWRQPKKKITFSTDDDYELLFTSYSSPFLAVSSVTFENMNNRFCENENCLLIFRNAKGISFSDFDEFSDELVFNVLKLAELEMLEVRGLDIDYFPPDHVSKLHKLKELRLTTTFRDSVMMKLADLFVARTTLVKISLTEIYCQRPFPENKKNIARKLKSHFLLLGKTVECHMEFRKPRPAPDPELGAECCIC